MASVVDQARKAILAWQDPYLGTNLEKTGSVRDISLNDDTLLVSIRLGYPAAGLRDTIAGELEKLIRAKIEIKRINIDLDWKIASHKTETELNPQSRIKNIIAVASGKGGVGKSTTAVNLALALNKEGAKVGILDADIYGPSQAMMLGVADDARPEVEEGKFFLPMEAHGLQAMSMGFLTDASTPMVMRGPMIASTFMQLLDQTLWHDLDYLIIDMPPGTGDIPLTLAQKAPVTGTVIVTTPQNIATLDAKKGIEMFRKVDIPVIGIVENMAIHICESCGHQQHIFGAGGAEQVAEEYDVPVLGALPLEPSIREQTDNGNPSVVANPEGAIALLYRDLARRMAAQLSLTPKFESSLFSAVNVDP
ncbi:MAG: iron-sulfur cluster carrier protein ApbC [Pseudomonadales bacterium]|nr:iron-sulfur cluster carrier protein ApbC [Pseudomonadales bacterium]